MGSWFLSRDWTHNPCVEGRVLNTGLLGSQRVGLDWALNWTELVSWGVLIIGFVKAFCLLHVSIYCCHSVKEKTPGFSFWIFLIWDVCRFSHTKQLSSSQQTPARVSYKFNLLPTLSTWIAPDPSAPQHCPTSTLIRHWTHTQIQRDILATDCKIQGSQDPFLGFNNLLKGSQNSVYFLGYWFIAKDVTQEEPDRKRDA